MEWNKTQALKQQKRRRTLIVLAALAVVLLVAGLAVRAWIRMPDVPDPSLPTPLPGQSESESGKKPVGERKEGVYTFLVAGKDVASGSTDTMLLLTYDTKAKTITGLNLPRDTMMNVTTNSKRLNAVFTYNKGTDKATQVEKGMTALKSAVADLTGILPDFYVLEKGTPDALAYPTACAVPESGTPATISGFTLSLMASFAPHLYLISSTLVPS